MKIYIGADHAGFDLKNVLIDFLTERGHEVTDRGAYTLDLEDDYPDFIIPVARAVADGIAERGIIIGGSGQGEAITANRFANVRAVVFNGQYIPTDGRVAPNEIVLSREHNDANILSLGARFLSIDEAKNATLLWLETAFSGEERHVRRLKKMEEAVRM